MVNGCKLDAWTTNSEVVLARSTSPLGPFEKVRTLVPPWAHNPQTIRALDPEHGGHVYALFTLGDGKPYHGAPKRCDGGPTPPPTPPVAPPPWHVGQCLHSAPHGDGWAGCIQANFSIFWSATPNGTYATHTAQIIDWPVHHTGTVYLLVHPEQYGFKHGMALLRAPSWRGPYTLVASDTFASWGGSTANAEDPYLWIDKRGRWHIMYEGNPMPGGHAYSVDGLTWSNISMANGGRNEGAFNLSRPYLAANGTLEHISLYTERPKLLLGADGATPTHLYGGAGLGKGSASFTLASPLSTVARRTEGR